MEKYRVEVDDGITRWFKFGTDRLHRTNGPAIEYADGDKSWYIEGELHRTDGPAVDRVDGYKWWYIEGKEYTEEEFKEKMQQPSCEGKTVEIDGKTYKLTEVE
jgi:hypothetical protein